MNILWETVMHLVLFVLVMVVIGVGIYAYYDGAFYWEEYYAGKVVAMINSAEPGNEYFLDVTRLSKIARRHGRDPIEMFEVDNISNEVSVRLRQSGGAEYSFFNDVEVVETRVELFGEKSGTNRLYFRITHSGGELVT
jgi:hypothetical protein